MILQWVNMRTEDSDEDQIWWLGEHNPPNKPNLALNVATGKFEGLKGQGTWHGVWPEGRMNSELPDGHELVVGGIRLQATGEVNLDRWFRSGYFRCNSPLENSHSRNRLSHPATPGGLDP